MCFSWCVLGSQTNYFPIAPPREVVCGSVLTPITPQFSFLSEVGLLSVPGFSSENLEEDFSSLPAESFTTAFLPFSGVPLICS